jgi:hypothetical protein
MPLKVIRNDDDDFGDDPFGGNTPVVEKSPSGAASGTPSGASLGEPDDDLADDAGGNDQEDLFNRCRDAFDVAMQAAEGDDLIAGHEPYRSPRKDPMFDPGPDYDTEGL